MGFREKEKSLFQEKPTILANGSGAFKKNSRKRFFRRYPAAIVPPMIFHGCVSA
jgi:hypothetical protein